MEIKEDGGRFQSFRKRDLKIKKGGGKYRSDTREEKGFFIDRDAFFCFCHGSLYRCVADGLLSDFFEIIVKYTNNTLHIRLFFRRFWENRVLIFSEKPTSISLLKSGGYPLLGN